jgi:hypothetical protein
MLDSLSVEAQGSGTVGTDGRGEGVTASGGPDCGPTQVSR